MGLSHVEIWGHPHLELTFKSPVLLGAFNWIVSIQEANSESQKAHKQVPLGKTRGVTGFLGMSLWSPYKCVFLASLNITRRLNYSGC